MTLRCVGVLLISSVAWADVEVRDNEVWLVRDGQERQLTHDGKAKLQAALSPGNDKIAYYEECPEAEHCIPSVVILDLDGKRLQSFQARPQSIPSSEPCASILNIAWVSSGTIGMECHASPSMSEYVEVDLQTGKNGRDLRGIGFTPSPDGRWVAHVGPLVHFAPPYAQSYYLLIDNRTVYPLPKGAKPTAQKPLDQPTDVVQQRGDRYIGIHEFVPKFAWSPDSKRVAFVDCTFDWVERGIAPGSGNSIGDEANRRCSVAIVALNGAFSLFPLSDVPRTSIYDAQISWEDNQHVRFTSGAMKIFRVR